MTTQQKQALVERIDAAIQRIVNGQGCMRIPAEPTDPDLVLADCKKFMLAAAPAAAPKRLDDPKLQDLAAGIGPCASAVCEETPRPVACAAPTERETPREDYPDPTPEMLNGDPLFDAIWSAIKGWDISRHNDGLYSGPTGNDARHIYDAILAAGASAPTLADAPTARMLTDDEVDESQELADLCCESCDIRVHELATSVQRKFCEVNNILLQGGEPTNEGGK